MTLIRHVAIPEYLYNTNLYYLHSIYRDLGPCDHSVNVCFCDLEDLITLLEQTALWEVDDDPLQPTVTG